MIQFGEKNLFATGPSWAHIGGLSLRHALQQVPGGQGVQLSPQGRSGRSIKQRGELFGDSPEALSSQTRAIEAMLDGRAYRWCEEGVRELDDVVMLSFEPGPMRRVGTRWELTYRVEYLQLVVG
ncbi:MAG: hypothetical protein HC898_04895 [Phycisphaerales bacterium]|nr:hypothetical protein [Phycisphaerales bacterium]